MNDNTRALLCELNGFEIVQVGVAFVPDSGSRSLALVTPWGRSHIASVGEKITFDEVIRRLQVRLTERGLQPIMGMEDVEQWIENEWRRN